MKHRIFDPTLLCLEMTYLHLHHSDSNFVKGVDGVMYESGGGVSYPHPHLTLVLSISYHYSLKVLALLAKILYKNQSHHNNNIL